MVVHTVAVVSVDPPERCGIPPRSEDLLGSVIGRLTKLYIIIYKGGSYDFHPRSGISSLQPYSGTSVTIKSG